MSMNLDWLYFLLSTGLDFCVRFPVLSTGVDVYESGLVGFFAVDWDRFLGKISLAVNWGRFLDFLLSTGVDFWVRFPVLWGRFQLSMNLDWLDFLLSTGVDFWVRFPVLWGRFQLSMNLDWLEFLLSTGIDFWVRFPVLWGRFQLSMNLDWLESCAVNWGRFLGKISCAVNWGRCL